MSYMAPDYWEMLRELARERDRWKDKRDEAERELARLNPLIRATVNMLPEGLRSKGEILVDLIENRPAGLTAAIRLSLTDAGKEWMTATDVRDYLKGIDFSFENYKSNPLASINTILKRLVPDEAQVKTLPGGRKAYRIKRTAQR
jgi:hypothetical protein